MYSSIIEIKKDVSSNTLVQLRKDAEKAFSNRAGSVKNSSNDPYKFVFKGDEDPGENCDILKVLAMPIY